MDEENDDAVNEIAQHAMDAPPITPEGQDLLGDFTGAEQQLQLQNTSEYFNLASNMDDGMKMEIAREIKNGYEGDDESRADWLDQHAFWMSLYLQNDYAESASPDRDWGATESIPILTEACNQFQSRTYKTFFPQDEFVAAKVMQHSMDPVKTQLSQERAQRIGQHMSWQLGVQNRNYKKDKNALFLGVAVHGSFFTKTYFDALKKKRPCIDNIRPTDLVVNYNCGPIRLEDVRRKSHIIQSTLAEMYSYVNSGYFTELPRPMDEVDRNIYDVLIDESTGLMPTGNSRIRTDRPVKLIEQHFYLDLNDTGQFLPYIGTIDSESGHLLRLTLGYEADPTGQPTKDYEQIQYFTHYKFQENPDGFYGLGLGQLIGDLNSAVNIMTRQVMDAATLANDGNMSGFISERLGLDQEDEVTLTIGKFTKIPDTTGDIQSGISMMKFPGPNEALMKIIEMLDMRAQRLGSTTEATTGTIDTNRQPTTVLSQIEQAMEMFSSVQMGLSDSLGDELEKIFRLNQKYLPLVEYFAINDAPGQIARMDYEDDMLIEPVFDPKFSTRGQKVAKAQAELQATLQNPMSQSRPYVYDVAFRRYLEAIGTDNIDELIPPVPTPQEIMLNEIHQAQQRLGQTANAQMGAQPGAAPPMAGRQNDAMGLGAIVPNLQGPLPIGVGQNG